MADPLIAHPMRVCTVCLQSKPETSEFFPKHPRGAAGLIRRCKTCRKAWQAANYQAKKAVRSADAAVYYRKNSTKICARVAVYRIANPGKDSPSKSRYQRKMRGSGSSTDLAWRVSALVRSSLRSRSVGGKAGKKWRDLVGYDIAALAAHLERQFMSRMTWENMGPVWHIDHILPIRSFSITSIDCPEFKACWALTNLRPLLKADNLSKGGKRLHLL